MLDSLHHGPLPSHALGHRRLVLRCLRLDGSGSARCSATLVLGNLTNVCRARSTGRGNLGAELRLTLTLVGVTLGCSSASAL